MHDALEVKEMKCWIEKHKNKDGKKNWLGERSERESFWKDGESEGMQEKEGEKKPWEMKEKQPARDSLQGDKKAGGHCCLPIRNLIWIIHSEEYIFNISPVGFKKLKSRGSSEKHTFWAFMDRTVPNTVYFLHQHLLYTEHETYIFK